MFEHRTSCMTLVAIMLLAPACGRIGFGSDSPTDGGDADARASCPGMTDVPDEDRDLVGDPCDVCPHVPDSSQADGDGDRVGDACDPEPMLARQRITFFDGFTTVLPEWNSDLPLVDGQHIVDVMTGDWLATLDIPTGTSVLQIAGTLRSVGTVTPQLFVGTSPAMNQLYYVELIDDGGGRRRSLMRDMAGSYTEFDGVREPLTIDPGPFMLALSIGNDRVDAIVDIAGATRASLAGTGTGTISGTAGVVFAASMSLVIDYVIMIETLP